MDGKLAPGGKLSSADSCIDDFFFLWCTSFVSYDDGKAAVRCKVNHSEKWALGFAGICDTICGLISRGSRGCLVFSLIERLVFVSDSQVGFGLWSGGMVGIFREVESRMIGGHWSELGQKVFMAKNIGKFDCYMESLIENDFFS